MPLSSGMGNTGGRDAHHRYRKHQNVYFHAFSEERIYVAKKVHRFAMGEGAGSVGTVWYRVFKTGIKVVLNFWGAVLRQCWGGVFGEG